MIATQKMSCYAAFNGAKTAINYSRSAHLPILPSTVGLAALLGETLGRANMLGLVLIIIGVVFATR